VDVIDGLASVLPGVTVSQSSPDRVAYSRDLWPRRLLDVRAGRPDEHRPRAVVWPETTEHVVALTRFAKNEGLALVPFGAGSGVCGGVEPSDSTIVVDLKKMRSWSIDRSPPLIDVGAGALGITLEEDLEREGFTIGHFPSSILCSTVGGWIAARGAGQCSGKYGKIEDMVVSLECVLGSGDVVTCERRFDGPNLVPLVIGSEGTLAIVTRARLRLHPTPPTRAFLAFSFDGIERGWDTLRELFQAGLRPSVSRLYDPLDSAIMKSGSVKSERRATKGKGKQSRRGLASVLRSVLRAPRALNAAIEAAEAGLLGGATLVLVFEGKAEDVFADAEHAREICSRAHAKDLGEGPARQWFLHRYSVSYRQSAVFRMGAFSDTMEVAAPWSRLGELYEAVRRALGEHVLVMAHLSHAYPDGCSIYFTFSGAAKDDDAAIQLYERAWRDALAAAISAGGTLSHHHGVGRSKAPKLGAELGYGIEVVRRMMHAWDPSGILNPGNLAPRDSSPGSFETDRIDPFVPGRVDDVSLLATFAGTATLGEAEEKLLLNGLTLDLARGIDFGTTIADFIAGGMLGTRDPWADPVDQTLAGFVANLENGARLTVRPAPRRAVGPDLSALVVGAGHEIGKIEQATLTVHRRGAPRVRALPFEIDRHPPVSDAERAAWNRIVEALRKR